jgi:hypothetical protein
MKRQIIDLIFLMYPKVKTVNLIYEALKFGDIDPNKFWNSTKNSEITFIFA